MQDQPLPSFPIVQDDLLALIPQRAPMVMIDQLLAASDTSATTSLQIEASNLFCSNGQLQAPGLCENIAQTAAAHAGFLAKKNQTPLKIGFIGAIKKLEIKALPTVGSQLTTEVSIEQEIMNFQLICGIAKVGDQEMASCEMKIFVTDQVATS